MTEQADRAREEATNAWRAKLGEVLCYHREEKVNKNYGFVTDLETVFTNAIIAFSKAESVTMFCKTHGYIKCDCPESNGLSMAQLQAKDKEIMKLKSHVDSLKYHMTNDKRLLAEGIGDLQAKLSKAVEALKPMVAKGEHNINDGGSCKFCGFSHKAHRKDCKLAFAKAFLTDISGEKQ